MNTLAIEAKLAQKYGYKKLTQELSAKYREYYIENIPSYLSMEGSNDTLIDALGKRICNGYERIVIGDYGAFVEFTPQQALISSFVVKDGEEYRIFDKKYNKTCKYYWYTTKNFCDKAPKIYCQQNTVSYADYKVGRWYISVHEVFLLEDKDKTTNIKKEEDGSQITHLPDVIFFNAKIVGKKLSSCKATRISDNMYEIAYEGMNLKMNEKAIKEQIAKRKFKITSKKA